MTGDRFSPRIPPRILTVLYAGMAEGPYGHYGGKPPTVYGLPYGRLWFSPFSPYDGARRPALGRTKSQSSLPENNFKMSSTTKRSTTTCTNNLCPVRANEFWILILNAVRTNKFRTVAYINLGYINHGLQYLLFRRHLCKSG